MTQQKLGSLGPLYNAIGNELAAIVGGEPEDVFSYLETGDGSVGGSVFKDEGLQVRYYDINRKLANLVLDAWESEPEDKRWATMKFEIVGNRFSATFQYPEELHPDEYQSERTNAAVLERYGDKPVIYPPMPEHFMEA